jgi:hypothetical protein
MHFYFIAEVLEAGSVQCMMGMEINCKILIYHISLNSVIDISFIVPLCYVNTETKQSLKRNYYLMPPCSAFIIYQNHLDGWSKREYSRKY